MMTTHARFLLCLDSGWRDNINPFITDTSLPLYLFEFLEKLILFHLVAWQLVLYIVLMSLAKNLVEWVRQLIFQQHLLNQHQDNQWSLTILAVEIQQGSLLKDNLLAWKRQNSLLLVQVECPLMLLWPISVSREIILCALMMFMVELNDTWEWFLDQTREFK